MRNGLFIGLSAGIVSALVLVAAAKGSLFGLFLLIFLAPLPIIMSGLGWGWMAAAVGAVAAGGVMALLTQPKAAALHFCAIGLPMATFAYLLMLNRHTGTVDGHGNPVVEWYPPGRVLGIAALVAGVLATLSIFSVATDMAGLEAEVRKTLERFTKTVTGAGETTGRPAPRGWTFKPGGKAPTEQDIAAFAKVLTHSFAAAVATFWMALACLNLWLGGLITKASGRLHRPWPDLSLLALPPATPLLFAAIVGLSFVPGYPGLIASGFASALFFAYLLVGLAIIHNLTQGNAARPFILFGVYLALFILNPFSGIIIAMIGIGEPILPFKRSFNSPPGPSMGG